MHIQVRINEEGALRNQRYAFSNKYTLVTELLQNARRAGATRIQIHYNPSAQILRVIDDGDGIEDFQKLLTLNESGWDDSCGREHPFGIGFSKCLYSANRCIVRSRGHGVDFLTEAALRREQIEVCDIPETGFTSVELHGVDLPELKVRLDHLCCGFPVPVLFNGSDVKRPYADPPDAYPCDIGHVSLAGTTTGEHSTSTLVFLQGFCVSQPGWFHPRAVNIVHLDPKIFIARLPDRDSLIDAEDQLKQIDQCLRALWRHVLIVAKSRLAAEMFTVLYYDAARAWGHLDLLNDIPVLPRQLCSRIADYPIQGHYSEETCLVDAQEPVRYSEVDSGQIKVVDLEKLNDCNAGCWMLAHALGYIHVRAGALSRQHWIHAHLQPLPVRDLRVDSQGEQCRTLLEGRHVCMEVILCESVLLRHGDLSVEIHDHGVYHDGVAYIPAGEHTGEVVRQASDYMDSNDRFLEASLEDDRQMLAELIQRLRLEDPVSTLNSLLCDLRLEQYPLLQDHVFQLRVARVGHHHGLELIA